MDCERRTEKNRDRAETRSAYATGDTAWLYGKEKWEGLNCIGAIKTEFEKDGRKTEEWHYYISSRKLSAAELLPHARMKWAVETMHWLLDVHYGEDYCRIACLSLLRFVRFWKIDFRGHSNTARHNTVFYMVGVCLKTL